VNDSIVSIPINDLIPHPQNPRLAMRMDVIDAIIACIRETSEYKLHHAITVRPYQNGYQIISGHHRVEAAKRAELNEIPCHIVEMTDDEAYMELMLSNQQSEISPLELGIHLLRMPQAKSGRGNIGGLREYARLTGRDQADLCRYRQGASVYRFVVGYLEPNERRKLLDKCLHLSMVSKFPQEEWVALTRKIIRNNLSSRWVKQLWEEQKSTLPDSSRQTINEQSKGEVVIVRGRIGIIFGNHFICPSKPIKEMEDTLNSIVQGLSLQGHRVTEVGGDIQVYESIGAYLNHIEAQVRAASCVIIGHLLPTIAMDEEGLKPEKFYQSTIVSIKKFMSDTSILVSVDPPKPIDNEKPPDTC